MLIVSIHIEEFSCSNSVNADIYNIDININIDVSILQILLFLLLLAVFSSL